MRSSMIVESVIAGSIADEIGIKKGDVILSINNEIPRDIIEYSFLVQDETLELRLSHSTGELEIVEIEKDFDEDLGISFKSAVFDRIKPCQNKCIFCFVDQQPAGLRESLYVKDDDWRLSYLDGTYITLTNLDDNDWARIDSFRPSPLFVSVHTTNPTLRAEMMKNPNAAYILENLRRLENLNIELAAQIVLCPKINDGAELSRTLSDLSSIKTLKSIAIVPLGISKYQKNALCPIAKEVALETIKISEDFNKKMKKNIVNLSDEFFMLAKKDMPERKYYGKFLQIEDGVGAVRLLLDDFARCLKKMKKEVKKPSKLSILTSISGENVFGQIVSQIDVKNLTIEILPIANDFFGEKITVTGLVTGSDIIKSLKNKKIENLLVPSIMLKANSDEFLDGITLQDIKSATGARLFVIKDCYSFGEILKIINSL